MPKVNVYDMTGGSVGEMNLSDDIFGITPNTAALHMVIRSYLANRRRGTQSTLTRAEVSGGGRKPWRQKGTGRARQGSTRSPQWRHGGVALGPKPRSYSFSLNRKLRKLAIKSALSAKVTDSDLIILDSIEMAEYKTKTIVKMLNALGADKKALIVLSKPDGKVIGSAGNIPGVTTVPANSLNAYDIMNHDKLIIVKDAALMLEEVYSQ